MVECAARRGLWLAGALGVLLAPGARGGELAPETASVATLPAAPSPHWLWVSTLSLGIDGTSYLVDGDSGHVLGMLSTGFFADTLAFAPDHRAIYGVETYFSRGSRGERTDVVTVYDPASLAAVDEIVLPTRRAISHPMPNKVALSDDGRFLWIYNYTPGQSVSVVDVAAKRFAGEIETSGCALVYPSGARRFRMLCGDGSLLSVVVNEQGSERRRQRSPPFFDPRRDPVTEKAVRAGDRWLFVSGAGLVHPVDASGDEPIFEPVWSLFDAEDRAGSWQVGGTQHLALHEASGTLYAVVHRGEPGSYKQPGSEIWVYDLGRRERVRRLRPRQLVQSLGVSQDGEPLLFSAFMGSPSLDVYDARSGEFQRTVPEMLLAPNLIQVPWRAARP